MGQSLQASKDGIPVLVDEMIERSWWCKCSLSLIYQWRSYSPPQELVRLLYFLVLASHSCLLPQKTDDDHQSHWDQRLQMAVVGCSLLQKAWFGCCCCWRFGWWSPGTWHSCCSKWETLLISALFLFFDVGEVDLTVLWRGSRSTTMRVVCNVIGNVPTFYRSIPFEYLPAALKVSKSYQKFVNIVSRSQSSCQVRRSGRRDRFERSQLACNVFIHLWSGKQWPDHNLFDRSYQPGLGSWGSVSLWSVLTESCSVLALSRPNIQNWRDL